MRWLDNYHGKRISADEAVKAINSGNRVYIHPGCASPIFLIEAMVGRSTELQDVDVIHVLTMGDAPYTDSKYEGIFRHTALFIGHNTRQAVNEGRADAMPIFLYDIPGLFKERIIPIDVALIHVGPPDEHGFCSYGVGIDVTKAAAESAKIVIAQINPKMPRALGDSFIHVNKITHVVEHEADILEMPQFTFDPGDPATRVPLQIGEHTADLIGDGSTLQMGIGTIPDAILYHLQDKKDLGIHTEMFSDGVVDLVEDGVITNEKKTIHTGKMVAGFVLGTKKTYDFIDNNPVIEFRPTEYVNDVLVIARHDKMVAINSAIEVDLTGQVCADSIGTRLFSGFGGQVDFIRGAARSKGGVPIIALPSTVKNDSFSRIVPQLKPGAGVVTSRADVHWVVTEYGAVNLHGKTFRERAKLLISIAHPKFKDELEKYVKDQHLA
ncbi:MAG: acetyl-CoA hydrolase/transferase C-terminal domain-containing protein [Candidatus Electryonea clarkiae]|nr:acetyl-CoA hydrolase/transferase C-terminal domain-containing protein [Candidatus Electryonea clarkiae]MDP8286370.1 acetyl-CoA hydrolase/transferase C-terminal domain-containing protein [Candidatus Electryonea clarkiae]